jgi:hypothetical protein
MSPSGDEQSESEQPKHTLRTFWTITGTFVVIGITMPWLHFLASAISTVAFFFIFGSDFHLIPQVNGAVAFPASGPSCCFVDLESRLEPARQVRQERGVHEVARRRPAHQTLQPPISTRRREERGRRRPSLGEQENVPRRADARRRPDSSSTQAVCIRNTHGNVSQTNEPRWREQSVLD